MWRCYLCYCINQGDFGEGNEGNLGLWAGRDEALKDFLISYVLQSQGGAAAGLGPAALGRGWPRPGREVGCGSPARLSPLCQLCSIMGNPLSFRISAVFRSALY